MPEDIVATPESGTPAPVATPVAGTPAPQATPAPTQANGSAEWDKQRKGLTDDLAKERKARQDYEGRVKQYEIDLAAEKKRVQALAGVTPQTPDEADADEVRKRFTQLYPHLGGLTAEKIDRLMALADQQDQIQQTSNHYWSQHSRTMVAAVHSEVAAAYGGKLTDRQVDKITKAYALRANADPEFLQRHENGDPTLAKEFAKEWVEDWFEPARRQQTAAELSQFRRVPGGKDRSIVNQGEKKINVTNDKEVEDMLVAGFRERGGQFGR